MDLGRGNLIFPQLWGDPNLLNDDNLHFLSEMMTLVSKNESTFLCPRRDCGNVWKNEPYGYAFFDGSHGFVFCNNVHFASRSFKLPLGPALGLSAPEGMPLQLTTHFPEWGEIVAEDGSPFRTGLAAEVWLRPFETLLLEVGPPTGRDTPRRDLTASAAAKHGVGLQLRGIDPATWMELKFADAERFEKAGMRPNTQCFACRLPRFDGRSVLAIHVALKKGGAEYRYSPVVAELVQIRARLANRDLPFVPVPDSRQYGNTQHACCSWVVYKVPVSPLRTVVSGFHTHLSP